MTASHSEGRDPPLTRGSPDPLYLQIAAELKQAILLGIYPVGSQLPTETALSRRFAVSRYTVRAALGKLRDDGLVASRRGAGTVVVPPPSKGSRRFGALSIEDVLHFANGSFIEIEEIGITTLDIATAARTGLGAQETWLRVGARGYSPDSDAPLGFSEYFIHRDFAGVARLLGGHRSAIFPLIEAMYGVQVDELHQEISALVLDAKLARRILVDPGAPALEVRHSFRLSDGRLAQLTINTHPAERYRHAVTFRRTKPA